MTAYILRRLLLIVPTMIGIMLVTFVIVQFAPGGPVERLIAQLSGTDVGATERFGGGGGEVGLGRPPGATPGDVSAPSKYRGAQGLDPEFIKSLEKQFGFDKPAYERFLMLMWNYFRFDFGESYFRDTSVLELIAELTQLARRSTEVSQRSGVSVRVSIANIETLSANAVKRAVRLGESRAAPRISDLPALVASTAGKVELETLY